LKILHGICEVVIHSRVFILDLPANTEIYTIPFWRGKVFVYSFMILLAAFFAFLCIKFWRQKCVAITFIKENTGEA
jgi:hypothetical protein